MNIALKDKLRANILTIGSWITLGHTAIAEIFARAGFDWVVVDMEHTTISIEQAGELIRVIDLAGAAPLVRLSDNDPVQIKRVMDAGASGIVVPMVNSPEDASIAVSAMHYAPQGKRGVGLARAQGYGATFRDYLQWQKDSPILIVQIEHYEAVKHLEDILAVPDVDGFIIGPYDLSCSMNMPGDFQHPEFQKTMQHILSTGLKLGCPAGLHIVEPDVNLLQQAIKDGYRFIAYSVDIRMLDITARAGLSYLKEVT